MAKRWLNSLDVEIGRNGAPLIDSAGYTSIAGGTKTVTSASTPEPLTAVATPCRFVWIGAPVDDYGNPLNTQPCFIGDSANQNVPIMPSNYEGVVIHCDDAANLFIKVGIDNQSVMYRIFA